MAAVINANTTERSYVRDITSENPWIWLSKGWADFRAAPLTGAAYGAVFAVIGYLLVALTIQYDALYMILPLTAGFLLLGPMLAVGLYEIARRREAGEPFGFGDAVTAFRRNPGGLSLMGVLLLVFMFAWVRFAALLFMLFFGDNPPNPAAFFSQVFLSADNIWFLVVGVGVGAVIAFLAFAVSAVSIPMLLHRPETNVIQAVLTSLEAVKRNFTPMLLWAFLIVLFTGIGLITFFIGLIVTLPLIGYATWHAYRDLVDSRI